MDSTDIFMINVIKNESNDNVDESSIRYDGE
jgi:hypothetical protein